MINSQPIILLLDSREAGGIETHVLELAKALSGSGWSVEIWFCQRYNQPHPIEPHLNSEQLQFRYLQGNLRNLYSTVRRFRPLLIHTHGYKAGVTARLISVVTGAPIVSTFHNGDPGKGRVRLYTLLDCITSLFSVNIAISVKIAKQLFFPARLINNFVQLPARPAHSGQSIAFVGRLSHEKGPDLFLQLARHQHQLEFRVYGSGPMEPSLHQQGGKNVKFMGQVSSMADHWQHISLLCITSRYEGLPMVALEAMSHGIPVLSFEVGDVSRLVQQGVNGWCAPAGNLKSMSSLLQFWHSLPREIKKQLSDACIDTVTTSYSPTITLPLIIDAYQEAVEKKNCLWPLENRLD